MANEEETDVDYEKLVEEFELEFVGRYTDEDSDFVHIRNKKSIPPPCVFPWYNEPRRNFDYTRRDNRHRDNRNRDDHRSGGDNRYHPYNRPFRGDRGNHHRHSRN